MCINGVNIIIKLIIGSWVCCKQHTKQEKDENEKKDGLLLYQIHFGDPSMILLKELRPPASTVKSFHRFCGGSSNVCDDKNASI